MSKKLLSILLALVLVLAVLPAALAADSDVTVSVSIADYASANSWKDATQYKSLKMDDVVTVSVTGTTNTGKYYVNGNNWRIYQTEAATVTVAAAEGNIVSVKITYTPNKNGCLTNGSTKISSDTVVEVNAPSITFGLGNTGTATNGQVRITNIEVVYAVAEAACEHDWVDATCTVAKTCSVCGETEGEALGHDWTAATCTVAKTCSVCGETEGEALGHDWTAATCQAPKTCSVCGETEGTVVGHSYVDGTCKYGCGTAEPVDDLVIESAAELIAFAEAVNGGNTYQGKVVELGADIDLNSVEWTPITGFKGTFDGKNYTIKNLVVTGNKSNAGLFGKSEAVEIKNLTVENALVSGRLNVGVVAGHPWTTKFTNITVTGHVEVNGMAYVGGVGGKNAYANWTNITVNVDETSYVNANSVEDGVAYRTYVGGVVGFMGEGGHAFTNVTSNIDVIGSTCDVGGITGIAHYGNSFINCVCTGDVTVTGATEAADAEEMGGIAGVWHNQNGYKVTFDNCVYTGTLTANITEGVDLSDNTITGKAYSASGTGELVIKNLVAKIGEVGYYTLKEAFADVKEGETIQLLPVTIEEGEITLPSTLKNVTIKGVEGAVLKGTTLARRTAPYIITGLTVEDVVFENCGIIIVSWSGECALEDWTITGCTFRNLSAADNVAALHLNVDVTRSLKNLTFTNNVVENLTGGDKSGIYGQYTGTITLTGNVFHNIAFRPYVIQITTDDGVADVFTVTGNTFSGSAKGRAQGLGNNDEGTDSVTLSVTGNIFKDITNAQQICYWNFNPETTTADLSKNYYDIDLEARPNRIYYNKAASSVGELVEMGIYPVYTQLNSDGTIDTNSLYNPPVIAKIGDVNYYALADAIAAAGENDVVTLVQTPEFTGLLEVDGTWYYFDNGALDTTYAGLFDYYGTLFAISNGTIDWGCNGLVEYNGGLYYVANGVVDASFTGLFESYYVVNGVVDTAFVGVVEQDGSLYYVSGGVVDVTYTSLAQYNGVWYYVNAGVVDLTYTGLADYYGTQFYVVAGMVDWSSTGLVAFNGGLYYISGGVVDLTYTSLAQFDGVWYYVNAGVVDLTYTGLAEYYGTQFYVANGTVDWETIGLVACNGGLYYVAGGTVDLTYTSLAQFEGVWYYVINGVVDTGFTGMVDYYGTWFYIANGMVDWGYTGLAEHGGNLFYINGGVLDWSYTGPATGPDGVVYPVIGGVAQPV